MGESVLIRFFLFSSGMAGLLVLVVNRKIWVATQFGPFPHAEIHVYLNTDNSR